MKSTTSAIALAACFAPLAFASPMHMLRHAEADVDVKYVTDTAVVTDYAHVTQYVTAGEPERTNAVTQYVTAGEPKPTTAVEPQQTTAVTVTAESSAAASSAAAPANHKNAGGDHHWSYSHEQQPSSAPAPPAPAPPAPTTTSTTEAAPTMPANIPTPPPPPPPPSTTAAAPSTTAAAATSQAPAANNPGTNTAALTYTSAIAAPTPSSFVLTGDEAYNPYDGTLQAATLNSTNWWRSQFQAPAVTWNLTLEQQVLTRNAPGQDTRCLFQHGGTDGGQNIGAGYDGPTAAIGAWGSEYDPNVYPNGIYNGSANHFSQLVWKDMTSVGCAAIHCPQDTSAQGWFYVCNYWPVGNMGGEYQSNVMNKKSS